MFLIAVPYLIFSGKFEPEYLLINLFALLHNDDILYVSFSWYIKVYLTLLLILPLIARLSKRIHHLLPDVMLHVVLPIFVRKLFLGSFMCEEMFVNLPSFLLSWLALLATWYPYFGIGMLCAKYHICETLCRYLACVPSPVKIPGALCVMISVLAVRNLYFSFLFEAPYCFLYAMAFILLAEALHETRFMKLHLFLGKYSFQFWLLSGMFFLNTAELQPILYFPYYWPLIIVWAFLLLTPFAVGAAKLSSALYEKITSLPFLAPCGQ